MAVPVLAVTAVACSDGGDDGGGTGGKKDEGQSGESGSGSGSGGAGSSGGRGEARGGDVPPLGQKELDGALLKSGDVKGYRAQRDKDGALPAQNTMKADDPRCSPITDVVDSKPEHARKAYASGVLMKGSLSTGGAVQQVLLSSYGKGGAEQWLAQLKKAVRGCDSFTGQINTGERTRLHVEPGEGVGVGDDSVRFTMEDTRGKDSPTVFTIVRTGGNTASFMSVSLSGEPQGVALSLVKKQHEKLTAAAEGKS
ncbi:hypothetical protein HCC61_24710 [Streptomyces sp. HNM0575]|uniref:hypothetical protein n=1 Tax=Streptomyces sp. HNM0575 TaxID=2716338 RepID=UPI00145C58C0|nr:hypothetical protein [Streptomyces sp. HNM0575]NLU75812.1 hypothetical protein [Streptomyces sp. HNM0575]